MRGSTAVDEEFVRSLAAAVPPLRPIVAEHEEFFEELLPHVVMSDVTRWADATARSDTADADLQHLLSLLESAMAGGTDNTAELVHGSFLENLDDDSPVIALLGPAMRHGLAQIRGQA